MNDTQIFEKVKGILAEQLGVSEKEIKAEQTLIEDLGCDSLDMVELAMAFEEEFDFEVNDERLEQVRTVQDAINIVKEKQTPSQSSAGSGTLL